MITQGKWLSTGVFVYEHDTCFEPRKGTNLTVIALQFVFFPLYVTSIK